MPGQGVACLLGLLNYDRARIAPLHYLAAPFGKMGEISNAIVNDKTHGIDVNRVPGLRLVCIGAVAFRNSETVVSLGKP